MIEFLRCTSSAIRIRSKECLSLQPHRSLHRRSRKKYAEKRLNLSALHDDFHRKVIQWKELLNEQIAVEKNEIRRLLADPSMDDLEWLGQVSEQLIYQSQHLHAIHGRIIVMRLKEASRDVKSFMPRVGAPVLLCNSEDFSEIQQCVVHARDGYQISLKAKTRENVRLNSHDAYILLPSASLGYKIALDEFLGMKWRNFPGEKLVHYVHCFVPLPVSRAESTLEDASTLNMAQRFAVSAALNRSRPIVSICGPPGTGKTAVIVEIIERMIRKKQKVLVCAPSNVAITNVVERIKNSSEICMLGMNPKFSLNEEVERHGNYDTISSKISELDNISEDTQKERETKKAWKDTREMLWDIKEDVIRKKRVVASTLTSSSLRWLIEWGFKPDVTIIDEAAQALECVAWYAMLLSPRAIIVGDPWQLPPFVKNSRTNGLENVAGSLMDALTKRFGDKFTIMLTEQYRMNEKITKWPSQYFYASRLEPANCVREQRLSDISDVPSESFFNEPVLLIDTSLCANKNNCEVMRGHSFYNQFEANIVVWYTLMLKKYNVRNEYMCVITPYAAQVDALRLLLKSLSINSVDAFQGQEKEVVIMSMVRNNSQHRLGFLKDVRRLNVAVTRARRQFVLVGSSEMMQTSDHLDSLLRYTRKEGRVIRAEEIMKFVNNTDKTNVNGV